MCRAAGRGEDDLEAARLRGGGVLVGEVGRAVRGHHADLVGHAELGERFVGLGDEGPVGVGAHDEADEGGVFHGVRKAGEWNAGENVAESTNAPKKEQANR